MYFIYIKSTLTSTSPEPEPKQRRGIIIAHNQSFTQILGHYLLPFKVITNAEDMRTWRFALVPESLITGLSLLIFKKRSIISKQSNCILILIVSLPTLRLPLLKRKRSEFIKNAINSI